jgi:hypothetical protein
MARNQPAKKAKQKSAARKAASKPAKKTSKKAPKKAARKAAKKNTPKRAAKPIRRPAAAKSSTFSKARAAKPVGKPQSAKKTASAAPKAVAKPKPKSGLLTAVKKLATAAVAAGVSAAFTPKKKPNLDRPRKTVADVHGIPSSLDMNRSPSAAKSGRAEMRDKLSKNNSGGAAITAGDVDADWQSAESVGDEAPGGDNPTPDQDVVDDIGRALGVEYADDEELQGGAEIADRDSHRWELDPSSKDDFEDEE